MDGVREPSRDRRCRALERRVAAGQVGAAPELALELARTGRVGESGEVWSRLAAAGAVPPEEPWLWTLALLGASRGPGAHQAAPWFTDVRRWARRQLLPWGHEAATRLALDLLGRERPPSRGEGDPLPGLRAELRSQVGKALDRCAAERSGAGPAWPSRASAVLGWRRLDQAIRRLSFDVYADRRPAALLDFALRGPSEPLPEEELDALCWLLGLGLPPWRRRWARTLDLAELGLGGADQRRFAAEGFPGDFTGALLFLGGDPDATACPLAHWRVRDSALWRALTGRPPTSWLLAARSTRPQGDWGWPGPEAARSVTASAAGLTKLSWQLEFALRRGYEEALRAQRFRDAFEWLHHCNRHRHSGDQLWRILVWELLALLALAFGEHSVPADLACRCLEAFVAVEAWRAPALLLLEGRWEWRTIDPSGLGPSAALFSLTQDALGFRPAAPGRAGRHDGRPPPPGSELRRG